jgi:hypothetical protein
MAACVRGCSGEIKSARPSAAAAGSGSVLKKKNQKTFSNWATLYPEMPQPKRPEPSNA